MVISAVGEIKPGKGIRVVVQGVLSKRIFLEGFAERVAFEQRPEG